MCNVGMTVQYMQLAKNDVNETNEIRGICVKPKEIEATKPIAVLKPFNLLILISKRYKQEKIVQESK